MDFWMIHNRRLQSNSTKLANFYLFSFCFFVFLLVSPPSRLLVNCLPIKFNNEYIRKFYNLKSLSDEQKFSLTNADGTQVKTLSELNVQVRYAKLIELTQSPHIFDNHSSLIDLFFPIEIYGDNVNQLEHTIKNLTLNVKKFNLQFLNLSSNGLRDRFLEGFSVYDEKSIVYSTVYGLLLVEYFSHVRMLHLADNNFQHLEHKHFEIFGGSGGKENPSQLEMLILRSNAITSVRHDTFNNLKMLKYIDLSYNKIKLLHPLTFSFQALTLKLLDVSNNKLKALFETPLSPLLNLETSNETITTTTETTMSPMANLEHLYLNKNNEIACDCGLMWLYDLKRSNSRIEFDEFKCAQADTGMLLEFNLIEDATMLNASCHDVVRQPSLHLNTQKLEETSRVPLFKMLSKRWFAWTVFHDHLSTTTPFPYLMDNQEQEEVIKSFFIFL